MDGYTNSEIRELSDGWKEMDRHADGWMVTRRYDVKTNMVVQSDERRMEG